MRRRAALRSARSRASGMRFMSTAALPRPIVPLMLSRAETWRRLPLTSTRVWSGLKSAQRRRAQDVGSVGDRRLREIERRHQLVEDLVGFGQPGVGQRLAADDVDRHRAVRDGAVGAPGAGDDDCGLLAFRLGRGSSGGGRRRALRLLSVSRKRQRRNGRKKQAADREFGHGSASPFRRTRPPSRL